MTYDERPEKVDHRDTEITLSNTTLLLIFLGVAIICGVFFGFGYTIGKRNTSPAVAMVAPKAAEVPDVAPPVVTTPTPAATETPAAAPDVAMSEKPSAMATKETPAAVTPVPIVKAAPAPVPVVKTPPAPVVKATPPPAPAPVPVKVVPPVTHPVVAPKPVGATKPAATKTKQPAAATATTPAPAPVSAPSRSYVVQVAAVSHQADADVLMGALRRKGYAVNSYPGTQDNLIHVQVGPFASQKDALAMRDKLSDDGYMAIVK